MEKINNSNSWEYSPSEVLKSTREPFNKNTVWIYPTKNSIEIRIFEKGWKTIMSTQDTGLSKLSEEKVNLMILELKTNIMQIIKNQLGKLHSDNILLLENYKNLLTENKKLELKIDKLEKKYSLLLNRIYSHARK